MKVLLLENRCHDDSRGEFRRLFDSNMIRHENLNLEQVNVSKNPKPYTLRGMHYQVSGPPEHKLISVLNGSIRLVVSNAHSVSAKKEVNNLYFDLSGDSRSTLFVPSGLATGWISRSKDVEILYMMTARYEECEYSGFKFNDPYASIDWPILPEVVSDKDLCWPALK